MSRATKPPRVVAELGRPETPEETASRLAENSRKYRARKTVNNLVLSLLATLAAVLFIVLIVPRSDTPLDRNVDLQQVATQAQVGVDQTLLNPELPAGWRANAATWRSGGSDKIASWYFGLLTPSDQFIGVTQALDANPTWLAAELKNQAASDTVTIDGVTWDVYRNTAPADDRGNFDYALATEAGTSTYVLVGTASEAEFAELATVLAPQIQTNGN
ncbi:DUF4245 domain-containing protein [Leifsonia sp. YAF41]|uniref:DUF4245 domain-containing protein n=1 Tax=Leifsonia sp. YAF41 TaxID=3233086 RepID=UPI003F968DAD